jgi:hypothetical protein
VVLLFAEQVRGEELTSPSLEAFDLPEGKPAWKRILAPPEGGPCRASQLVLFGDCLSLLLTSAEASAAPRRLLVKVQDGEVFDCASIMTPQPAPSAGSPVVLNGRVLFSDRWGVTCLMSLKP